MCNTNFPLSVTSSWTRSEESECFDTKLLTSIGFGEHQHPREREQGVEKLALTKGALRVLSGFGVDTLRRLTLLGALQAESDQLGSIHQMVQALSTASRDKATTNLQRWAAHGSPHP